MGLINDVVKRISFRFDFVLDGTLGLSGASEDILSSNQKV